MWTYVGHQLFIYYQIVDLVTERIPEGTVLLVVDHIPSNTPFIMPISEIVNICHSRCVIDRIKMRLRKKPINMR